MIPQLLFFGTTPKPNPWQLRILQDRETKQQAHHRKVAQQSKHEQCGSNRDRNQCGQDHKANLRTFRRHSPPHELFSLAVLFGNHSQTP